MLVRGSGVDAYVDMKILKFAGSKRICTCVFALAASMALVIPGARLDVRKFLPSAEVPRAKNHLTFILEFLSLADPILILIYISVWSIADQSGQLTKRII